jgi:hypothetical protein
MLTTILNSLQSLISARFVVASFFPALVFWFSNALMLFCLHEPFRFLANKTLSQSTLGTSSLLIASSLIGVAISAYALSAVMPAVQSLLEGNWPEGVAGFFAPSQARRLKKLEEQIADYRTVRGPLERYVNGDPQRLAWQKEISAARDRGCTKCKDQNEYTSGAPSAKTVEKLAAKREKSLPISADDITFAVNELKSDLATNDTDKKGPGGDYALERTRQRLWDLIDYAVQHAQDQHRRLTSRRRFSFGTTTIAPTRMGNVAQTIQSYAVERYDFNFELFWSRMQRVLQKDKDFSPILQAAKTQLDFLVASCALTGLWAICWGMILAITRGPSAVFFAVAFGGPLLAWFWYLAAVAHYRTFADVLRTSIDLFRFDLLNELHFPLPSGVLEERKLWNLADRLHALYEPHDLRYAPPKSTS